MADGSAAAPSITSEVGVFDVRAASLTLLALLGLAAVSARGEPDDEVVARIFDSHNAVVSSVTRCEVIWSAKT
ncbi:MAG: hypothetical protein ACAI25_09085 [Planctomycetota bacterium]